MNNAGRYFLVSMALLALSYPTAVADTLELKDGRLLEGTYVGGTRTTLRFQIEDRVEVIPIQGALAVTFSGSGPLASGPVSTQPSRPPRTFEQLDVFGTSSTGFPRSMVDPRWRPGSDWDSTDLNNFNPSRWYQARIDPSWKPQPAFTEDDDVTNFNPSRWQMGTLDPNWYPKDGFKRRDVSSPSE